jgi:hypothetical protein
VTACGASAANASVWRVAAAGASIPWARHREQIMSEQEPYAAGAEKTGKTIAVVFLAGLAAFFLYAYIPHFLFS